jgi:hypothetical protein
MTIPNDYDLDLQKIEVLLKKNNIDYLSKEAEIIATSNSIENRISCDIRTIRVVTNTPKFLKPQLFIFGLIMGFMVFIPLFGSTPYKKDLTIDEELFRILKLSLIGFTGFIAMSFALPLYLFIKPNVKIERNKIIQILRNYKE